MKLRCNALGNKPQLLSFGSHRSPFDNLAKAKNYLFSFHAPSVPSAWWIMLSHVHKYLQQFQEVYSPPKTDPQMFHGAQGKNFKLILIMFIPF